MPELPEVEVVRRGLDAHVRGRTFRAVEVLHPRATRGQVGGRLPALLVDASVRATSRRGKYLWLDLSTGKKLYIHLGMSGQMLVGRPGEVTSPHLRIRAQLGGEPGTEPHSVPNLEPGAETGQSPAPDPIELSFVDQRTFGQWQVVDAVADPFGPGTIPTTVAHIAADPLEKAFDLSTVARAIKRKNTEIKRVLLDQTVVSGIGNIYADEALFRAGVRPRRRASAISLVSIERILASAQDVMAAALEQGGTSFDSLYVNVNGASGYFSRSLNVYGRGGQPCRVCGHPISRIQFMGRSSHYCPQCQR